MNSDQLVPAIKFGISLTLFGVSMAVSPLALVVHELWNLGGNVIAPEKQPTTSEESSGSRVLPMPRAITGAP